MYGGNCREYKKNPWLDFSYEILNIVLWKYYFAELQPRIKGWLRASVDGQKTGIIPGNYVKILGKRQGVKQITQVAMDTQQNTAQKTCCSKENSTPKSCCSKSQNPPINPLENPLNQNMDTIYTENQTIDNNGSQGMGNPYNNMDNTFDMEAGDIVGKCEGE